MQPLHHLELRTVGVVEIPSVDMILSLKLSIGALIAALLDGGVLTLGINCILLLSSNDKRPPTQRRYLIRYLIFLLLANFFYIIVTFLLSHAPFIVAIYPAHTHIIYTVLTYMANVVPVLNAGLTDGLLVWRCYSVQSTLGSSRGIRSQIFWAVPLCFLSVTVATGLAGAGFVGTNRELATKLESAALLSNVLVNLYTTIFIVIRLVLHRRAMIACFGDKAPALEHLRLVNILLQAAAINVPITIVAFAGMVPGHILGTIATFIAITCQSFSAVLIIHQVALRKAIDEQGKQLNERRLEAGELTTVSIADNRTMNIP